MNKKMFSAIPKPADFAKCIEDLIDEAQFIVYNFAHDRDNS
jgi:hypothetical protein